MLTVFSAGSASDSLTLEEGGVLTGMMFLGPRPFGSMAGLSEAPDADINTATDDARFLAVAHGSNSSSVSIVNPIFLAAGDKLYLSSDAYPVVVVLLLSAVPIAT